MLSLASPQPKELSPLRPPPSKSTLVLLVSGLSPLSAATIAAPTARATSSPQPQTLRVLASPPLPALGTGGPACAPCPALAAPRPGRCFPPRPAARPPQPQTLRVSATPPRCFAAPRFAARVHRGRWRPAAPTSRPAPVPPCVALARPAPAPSPPQGAGLRGVHEARSVLKSSNPFATYLLTSNCSLFVQALCKRKRNVFRMALQRPGINVIGLWPAVAKASSRRAAPPSQKAAAYPCNPSNGTGAAWGRVASMASISASASARPLFAACSNGVQVCTKSSGAKTSR